MNYFSLFNCTFTSVTRPKYHHLRRTSLVCFCWRLCDVCCRALEVISWRFVSWMK